VHRGADGFMSDPENPHTMIEAGKKYGVYR